MPAPDLFDDSTMTFGEHLEVLRVHLFRSVLYLIAGTLLGLLVTKPVLGVITSPIKAALGGIDATPDDDPLEVDADGLIDDDGDADALPEEEPEGLEGWFAEQMSPLKDLFGAYDDTPDVQPDQITATVPLADVRLALHRADPERYPKPTAAEAQEIAEAPPVTLHLRSPQFQLIFEAIAAQQLVFSEPTEPFMIYLKAAIAIGFVLASPLIFWEVWQFVAAGLYPHERSYVYLYLPFSLGLFFGGALFCFFAVFPYVLPFLLGYGDTIGAAPMIQIGKWFSFVLFLPLVFGVAFQLPLVMLFLQRVGILRTEQYTENWRMAVLVLAVLSMLLTPQDPTSMLAMLLPMIGLYFAGIGMCKYFPSPGVRNPFGEDA